MAKDTYYFPHDLEPTSDPKIQAMLSIHGGLGYGVYWRIVEMLHSADGNILPVKNYTVVALAKQMLSTSEAILQIIDDCVSFELLTRENGYIFCDRVNRNISKRAEIVEKRKEAGKRGGLAKAKQMLSNSQADDKQNLPIKGNERKGKELSSIQTTISLGKNQYSEDQNKQYQHFLNWIATNTPLVNKLPKPITIKEFLILSGQVKNSSGQFMQISGIEIKEILEKIENNKVYLKKYRSPYLCITHWTKNNRTKQNV